ncbi:hypothetical protein M406DRAFT_332037 [Cryphonectria parasitica EP155]|uniref:Uncharacterized protein n=1 Tax=Cryphonectria parasitica (strain ATCC 38755 / EP155) TaxID=660469 RepID=A0A9P4XYX1_CRYP1|nr:uncharacterized protein M406DRAFT_332037 [Cryphonectria parasitica EP155]KAF3763558.1 hypothetical protein M406DRAFT_332037 [Cryphonectria parasitica EP155]
MRLSTLYSGRSDRDQIRDQIRDRIRNDIRNEIRNQIRDQLHAELHGKLRNELRTELLSEIYEKLRGELQETVRDQVKEEIRTQLHEPCVRRKFSRDIEAGVKYDMEMYLDDFLRKDDLSEWAEGFFRDALKTIKAEQEVRLRRQLKDALIAASEALN